MISRKLLHRVPAELFCAAAVFIVTLLLYDWTLAPTVTLVDSGELIVVAHGLGVAHPPGFPLWVLLAHLASLVPLGNVAQRVNFSSAFFAAFACAILTLVVAELMIALSYLTAREPTAQKRRRARTKKIAPHAREAGSDGVAPGGRLFVLAPALGAGLLMGFSRTLWAYATIAEVYTLNALLVFAIFFLMLRWRRRIMEDRKRIGLSLENRPGLAANTRHDLLLYLAAFIFGLALGVHHVTVALTLPALAVIVLRTEGVKFFASRRLLYAALISTGALVAIYAYLPMAAARAPLINWGNPRSLEEIWWHITGRQYQVFLSFAPATIGKEALEFFQLLLREFGFPWFPLALVVALAGFARAFQRDRTAFWFLAAVILADLAYGFGYEIGEDKDAYYLATFAAVAIGAGFGIRWLLWLLLSSPVPRETRFAISAMAVILPLMMACAGNWPYNNRRHCFVAEDYVENVLRGMKPDGLLLTADWQLASPLFYLQEIEHRRRDAKVVDINLLRRSWYFDYLRHAAPGLIERSRDQIDLFVGLLKAWEQNPLAFARSPSLTQRIETAFRDMIEAMTKNEGRVGPVYVTRDVLLTDPAGPEVSAWLTQNYQLVPDGLVFNLTTDRTFQNSPEVPLQTRGLTDGTMRYEEDDVVNQKVLPTYTTMLINRARYLAAYGHDSRALALFDQALALDPELAAARQGRAAMAAKLSRP
jgi:hypothetical protein